MRGLRRAERLHHLAIKQVVKPGSDLDLDEQWMAYFWSVYDAVGFLRMREWWWTDESEGC
jgi:hypothetical protein